MVGKMETVANYNETLEKDLHSMREQVAQLNNKVSMGEDITVKNQGERNRAEIEIVDLRQNYTAAQEEVKRLTNELGQYRQDLA